MIARALKKARGAMSQSELSRLSGVSQSEISLIESGDRPNPGIRTVAALEAALGLAPGALIHSSPAKTNPGSRFPKPHQA